MNNHNSNDKNFNKMIKQVRKNASQESDELLKMRVKQNIISWKNDNPEYKNIKKMSFKVERDKRHFLLMNSDYSINDNLKKLLILNAIAKGIQPSKIRTTTLNECYSTIRGFSDDREIKNNIFSMETEILVIEDFREIRDTDVINNVISFWNEMGSYLSKNKKVTLILVNNSPYTEQKIIKEKKDPNVAYIKNILKEVNILNKVKQF